MNEVACHVLDVFFREGEQRGVPPEALAEGTGYSLAQLRDRHGRLDWTAFVILLRNAGRVWSNEELTELGLRLFRTPYLKPFLVFARVLFTPSDFYRWMFEQQSGGGDRAFNCVDTRAEELSDGWLRLDARIREGYAPCPEFFHVVHGSLIAMPQTLGAPPARVQMELAGGRSAVFWVEVRKAVSWWSAVRRALAFPFQARQAAVELKTAQEALLLRFRQLDAMQAALDRKAGQLALVSAMGRRLARRRELSGLGDDVAELLLRDVGATGAALWVRDGEPATLREIRRVGAQEGPPQAFPLESAGTEVGRLDVWGLPEAETEVVDALLPWIGIALENARSFTLLERYQSQLEERVEQRTRELNASLRRITEVDRQKTQFFSSASHELRTPLALVIGQLEALHASARTPPGMREELEKVSASAYRLMKLVNDVLDLAKIEAGRMELRRAPFELGRLIASTLEAFGPIFARRALTVRWTPPDGALLLQGDAERVEQILLNLLSNAAKYADEGGAVEVSCAVRDGGAELRVENTGEPIPEADIPTIFDRFAQAPNAGARRSGTTGLGLAMVRELVALHGGSVVVENGARSVAFRVWLPEARLAAPGAGVEVSRLAAADLAPFAAASAPDVLRPDNAPPTGELPVLLIAEDQAELRALLASGLRGEYQVLQAADGAEALALAREHLPDIVLTDLMMPEVDGAQLCMRLKQELDTAGIPVVMLTARADLETKLSALASGADDYISKPFHLEEVRLRLGIQLRLRRLTRELAEREKLSALGVVVAGVAHEIRNPLNAILNTVGPARERVLAGRGEVVELLDLALEAARRVEDLSTRLLQQARAGSGGRTEVDVGDSVETTLQLLAHRAAGGPALHARVERGAGTQVLGDPGALGQVWMNLIDNAVHAAGREGNVWVEVGRRGGWVTVDVRDDGPGIAPVTLRKIFDPFFTTKPVGQGTGLGLAIAREIVQRHGGDLHARSAPGQGATFSVRLPVDVMVSEARDAHA